MRIEVANEQKTVIIGGGIAGLAAAWYCQQAGIDYTVLEASERLGGLIQTRYAYDCMIEFGPDAFITRKPWAMDLVREIGLEDAIIAVNDTPERIYVLADGQLAPLPDGLRLLVPTNINAFFASPLMSLGGKLRVMMDYVIPANDSDEDESLADFVIRRMGQEALDKLADPLLAGVYNAEMDKQSILATFPQYRALEKKHGSLIRGMTASLANAPVSTEPALVSFQNGMAQLIDTLASKLTGEIRMNARVSNIQADYKIDLENGDSLTADTIILATQAHNSANLLTTVATNAADGLSTIRYAGIGSMSLIFNEADVPQALDAYGVVIPSSAGRMIDGMQWSNAKWVKRAPASKALIRVFFGGPHTRYMLDKSEHELLAIIREELRAIMGITAKPEAYLLGTWANAYPQYDVGHIERIAAIENALPNNIAIAGNAYYGVGIPDTIKSAKLAVQKLQKSIIN
ncbi:MAG: protoporphyrinogen oxidase [Phototrophicaceae bacterium]